MLGFRIDGTLIAIRLRFSDGRWREQCFGIEAEGIGQTHQRFSRGGRRSAAFDCADDTDSDARLRGELRLSQTAASSCDPDGCCESSHGNPLRFVRWYSQIG